MKKKTLLTLVATGALIATTAGSYAAWDNYTATLTSTNTINFTNVDVTATKALDLAESTENGMPVYTGTVEINVAGVSTDELANQKITLTPTAKAGEEDLLANLQVTFEQTGDNVTTTDNVGSDTTLADTNSYTVKITPKDEESATKAALNGKNITFAVNATMSEKAK